MADTKTITITQEALKRINKEQASRVFMLLMTPQTAQVTVLVDYSLPNDYIAFNNGRVYGGIDPFGTVST